MKENAIIWYESLPLLEENETNECFVPNSSIVEEKKALASNIMQKEIEAFENRKKGSMTSDDKYLQTMVKNGTLSDRVAAMTLTIQASPFHCLPRIRQLILMAKKKARRESQLALESLKDLFINNLLPDRKLLFFHQQPLNHHNIKVEYLILWLFEHHLKQFFAEVVAVLEQGLRDDIVNYKRACLHTTIDLLKQKPEQESVLLSMLVNKLGDPDRQIASKAMILIQQLLDEHPLMKSIVAVEVERLLGRSNASDRTKYNAVLFLNQLYLCNTPEDEKLARHLIHVYFGLFTKEVGFKDDFKKQGKKKKIHETKELSSNLGQRYLSALLTGVNRAFPYANMKVAEFEEEMNTMFRFVHHAPFHTAIQALVLIFQVMSSSNSISDRFYTALYAKINDPSLQETSKYTMFLNLIFRSLKLDTCKSRICAMIKRLLQVASWMPATFACASLIVVSEIFKFKPNLRAMLDQPEEDESLCIDQPIEETLKIEEINQIDEKIKEDCTSSEEKEINCKNDEFSISPEEEARSQAILDSLFQDQSNFETTNSKSIDISTNIEQEQEKISKNIKENLTYDPLKRNPMYSNAERTCLWEISLFLYHAHPSVQHFAKQLINGNIEYQGDPLIDFTFLSFLDRFSYKNPKKKDTPQRQSGKFLKSVPTSTFKQLIVNSDKFLHQKEEQINECDRFFYKFFKERAKRTKGKKKKESEEISDIEQDEEIDYSDSSDNENKSKSKKINQTIDGEDPELEAFAQNLAEGLMKDEFEDEDPDMDDWSDIEEDEDVNDEMNQDISEEDEIGTSFDFEDMDGNQSDEMEQVFDEESDQEEDEPTSKSKTKTKKNKNEKKDKNVSPFVSADEYAAMLEGKTDIEEEDHRNESEEDENSLSTKENKSQKSSQSKLKSKQQSKKRKFSSQKKSKAKKFRSGKRN